MHYNMLVLVEPGAEITKELITERMAPWEERYTSDDEDALPEGFWDWWVIGGRWHEVLYPDQKLHDCKDNWHCLYTDVHNQFAGNTRPVAELKEGIERMVYGVLTPDGQWVHEQEIYEHPEFLGFPARGTDSTKYDELHDKLENEWRAQLRQLLVEHNACTAVSVDYHS